MNPFTLQDDMLLGVSLPATQCLGGEIESSWVYWWGLGYVRDHASPAVAAQHAAHWREDLALIQDLGAQSVRLGVDWTRVEPCEDEFDDAELHRIRDEIAALKAAGMRVTLELHRFTNPVWFEEKGGFEREENLSCYLSYIERVAGFAGGLVDEYLTFAEPNAYAVGGYLGGDWPPGANNPSRCYRVLTHMAQCHILAYGLLRQMHEAMGYPIARAGVSLRAREFSAATNSAAQRLLIATAERSFEAAFRAFCLGQTLLPMKYNRYVVPGKYCDFLAIDWYGRTDVSEPLDLTPFAKRGGAGSPKALLALARRLHALAPLPIHIALAGVEDGERVDLLASYLRALSGSSLPVERVVYAPLLDGFEQLDGNSRRLGLVRVDFETQAREIKRSGEFFRDLAHARGADAALLAKFGG
ncbi:MAG: glycoside hydrolase family 1 protein [Oscillospiraceae bacterium]|nr:glycoside hydrolase family 1 protein [Oscillospiraceae bacterium]